MKIWILKAFTQKIISFLPFRHQFNYFFQKYVTKGVYLTEEYFYDRLEHAKNHLDTFYNYSPNEPLTTCLELGTGWYPIVPISFFLCDVEKTYSVDITMLTSKDRIFNSIDKFKDAYNSGRLIDFLPKMSTTRFQQLMEIRKMEEIELSELLKALKIEYKVGDARKINLQDNTVDLVNSNNTFEHIEPQILSEILKEFYRVMNKDKGVMSHFIDMSDHFAHFDKSITIYNFLKFSDFQWKCIDNAIQPQNRLRIYDYQQIYKDLAIPISKINSRSGNLEELKSVHLDKSFSCHPLEEVAISHSYFISGSPK